MDDLNKFKNQIFIYGISVMLIIEVISLPIFGFSLKILFGLLMGTGIAIVNFNIMIISSAMILEGKNKYLASLSYLIRLLLYGGVFYLAIQISVAAGMAAVCGFMTLKVAILIIYAIIPLFKKNDFEVNDLKKEKQMVLIGVPQMIGYAGGRRVITHRRFIKYKR